MECYYEHHPYYESHMDEEAVKEYETSVYKYKDERDATQKKTFTKWVNKYLIKKTKGVVDLFEDLRDGNNLITLLEILSGEDLPREKGKMRVHALQNVQICLKFLKDRKIKLVNIRPDDIVDGNPKLTLGLIWTIILHFQLSEIKLHEDTISFKEALLKWARKTTEGYPDVDVKDFTRSWKDGLAFNAILHRNRPDLLDYRSCRSRTAYENLESAFTIAERDLGVTKLLDPEDCIHNPDEKSMITYISSLYELFPEPPENNPLLDKDRMKRVEEYRSSAHRLVKWIKESCQKLNDRSDFSTSLEEMKQVLEETHRFRDEEIPPRFNEKQRLVKSYKEILEMSLALPVRIEDEIKPESIEENWKKMLLAYQVRDKEIKEHMDRLEDLEFVVARLRKNIAECDHRLTQIEYKMFDELKRVQLTNNEPDVRVIDQITRELKFEEERIDNMMKDANYLLERRHPEGRDLYEQVKCLHQRFQDLQFQFDTKIRGAFEEKCIQKVHQIFCDYVSALLEKLKEQERIIIRRLHEPIPRKVEDIAPLFIDHERFNVETRSYQVDVEKVQQEFAKLPSKNVSSQSKFDALMDCWNRIWECSESYSNRLENLKVVLMDINDANRLICDMEIFLSKSPDMVAEPEQARHILSELKQCHSKVLKNNASFEKMLSNVSKVRTNVERSRTQHTGSHPDLDRLEEEVKCLKQRWDEIDRQLLDRSKSVQSCLELLQLYRNKMTKDCEWLEKMKKAVDEIIRSKELKNAKQLYEEASSRKTSIEETNSCGARFMKEAKIYDLKLKNYREKIEEYHPSVDASAKRSKIITGISVVEHELRQLNEEYTALLNRILNLLNQLQDDDSKLREFPSTITIKTYESFPGINSIIPNNNVSTTTFSLTNQCELSAKVQKYHQKIYTATVSQVPLSDQHDCKQLNISTLNVTQDIKSKSRDNIMEITVNRIYETDVKNKTFILKRSESESRIDSGSSSEPVLEDRLSEHEEFEIYHGLPRRSKASETLTSRRRTVIPPVCISSTLVSQNGTKFTTTTTKLASPIPSDVSSDTADSISKSAGSNSMPQRMLLDIDQPIIDQKVLIGKKSSTDIPVDSVPIQYDLIEEDREGFVTYSTAQDFPGRGSIQDLDPWDMARPTFTDKPVQQSERIIEDDDEIIDDDDGSRFATATTNVSPSPNKIIEPSSSSSSTTCDIVFPSSNLNQTIVSIPLLKAHEPHNLEFPDVLTTTTTTHYLTKIIDVGPEHDVADEFLRWLAQKEKTINSLEPICSEPRVLVTQLQQVQKLSEEFAAQGPVLSKIDRLADSLLDKFDRTSPQYRPIQEKQEVIHDKYKKLSDVLAERERDLQAMKDAAGDFQNKYDRLMAALHKISDDFNQIVDSGADGDEQLLRLSNLEECLENQRPNMADCDRACAKLCDLLTDNGSKNEVKNRVAGLRKFYDELSQKINDKKAELQSALNEDKDFFFNADALQNWLRKIQQRLSIDFKISAIHEKLLKQVDQFEPVYREILNKEHEVHILIQKGDQLQSRLSRPADINQVEKTISGIKRQYDELKEEATMQHTKLQKCLDISTQYRTMLKEFLPWLKQTEERLKKLQGVSLTKQEVEKVLRESQQIKSEISRHASEFEKICALGESLIATADIDTEVIREQVNDLKKRWNAIQKEIDAKLKNLEALLHKLANYDDKSRDLNQGLNRLGDKLSQISEKDPKQLEKIEALLEDSKKLGDDLDDLKKVGFNIIDEAGPDADGRPIEDQLKNFSERHNALADNLADRHKNASKASGAMQQFTNDLSAIQRELNSLEERLERMPPVGRKIQVVQMQIEEMKDFMGKLNKVHQNLREAERKCDDLIAKGFAPKETRREVDALTKKYEKVNEKSQARMKNLADVLEQLKRLENLMNQNMKDMKDLLKEIDNFKPISRDVDTIRSQQRELQTFVQQRVEPLKKKVDESNSFGNELVHSASPGVDVGPIEKELEKQNDAWNVLKGKIDERGKNLEQAFLQAGKFEDALKNVEKWLSETEEMVSKQKPPSSDYAALKAQLQEQKYLKKTLTDRHESIVQLQELGKALMVNLDRSERNQIERQLADVQKRFDRLMSNCDDRMKNLEDILPLAKEFTEKIGPLQEWLESSARKLNSLQAFSIEPAKLERRISEHQNFHQEVVERQRDFKNLSNIAQRLIQLIHSDEEGQVITDKLSEVIEKYAKLVEGSDALRKDLGDASRQINAFLANCEKISKWLDDMESRIAKHKVLNVNFEKLRDQHDDVQSISKNINSYQREVNELVHDGQSLVKQYSANDSLFVRQKIEQIQNKFNDLSQMVNDKLEHIRAAMNLAQKFYSALEQLNEWMDGAEKKLHHIDNLSISQQNEIITAIESDIPSNRRLLDTVNNMGSEFARTSPGSGAATINGYVSKCKKRFDAIVEQLQRKSERLEAIRKQIEAMNIDVDELLDWFKDAERQLLDAEPISANYDQLLVLLREVKALNDEINAQKLRVREVVNKVKKAMRDSVHEEMIAINNKTDELKELANHVSQLCQDRLNSIEHALPLVEHFFDTHNEIVQFLDDIENEVQMLAEPSIHVEQIRKQQETTRRLLQALKQNKSLFDRLNKTGDELIGLLQRKTDAHHIKQIMDSDNERYNRLKNALRDRAIDLENALQATSLFTDKLDGMLNALNNTADQLKNAEPISAHVKKIKEQIGDNNAILDDLKKREDAFNAVKNNAKEVISKAGRSDEPAIRDIKNKLEKLNNLWDEINRMANERGDCLDKALELAKQFWNDLNDVMRAIKEVEDALESQEPPALEPDKIQRQQDILSDIKNDMDHTRPQIEQVRQNGKNLIKLCGEPDRPEVRKHIEDMNNAWDNVTSLYAQREKNLIDAMDKAMNFHEKMRNLLKFLDEAEDRFSRLGPIAVDIDEVKRQIGDLKKFKNFVDPHMVDVETLNRMAHELLDEVPSHQGKSIRDAVGDINKRWKDLNKAISDRQSDLDNALLKLGQFQHSLNELLAWIDKMEKILDEGGVIYDDPQAIEVELAKHKVLLNDIQSHQANVDSLNQVGRQLMDAEIGSENARTTKSKLNNLNKRWNTLIDKANKRTGELEEYLGRSRALAQEIHDMMAWLNEIDDLISSSKPVGGLPETAREQLNRFMEIYNELDMNRHRVETLLQKGNDYVSKAKEGQAVNLQNHLKNLANKWESILARANDRKIKLEIALREATEFHKALQEFVDWLTSAEKYLNGLRPVSRVLDNVLKQIEEHKHFQKDIGLHRETMLNLDKKGTHLKYFSQKQDVTLIKNLLASVQHRWEKILTKAAERARALDHGFKEAKEFHDSWHDLIVWLEDAEKTLDAIEPMGNNPDLIKQTLYRHKDFQRQLGAKQSNYDQTMRFGKNLKEKGPNEDGPILQSMLDELKNKWNAVCQKSVDKQRKLEEALLFSGQFKDAIQALIEWLEKARNILAFDQPVHGDLDTVNCLMEDHRSFIEDFKSRENNLHFVRKTAQDLLKSANPEDARQIAKQMETLEEKWAEIERMMAQKETRLNDALQQASQLHESVQSLLDWLSEAELKLRFAGPLPEDESAIQAQIREFEAFVAEMKLQERNKNSTLDLANEIFGKCHPNAVPVIKHWITIIQSRWDEVASWAQQREKRLNDQMKLLKDASELMSELQEYLSKTENQMMEQDSQPLPEEIIFIEKLVDEHQRLIDELNDKRIDVDNVIKIYSNRKPQVTKDRSSKSRLYGKSPRTQFEPEIRNPKAKELLDKWHSVWRLASDRMKRLKEALHYNREVEKMRTFDFDVWRKSFLLFMGRRKSRMMDFFKRMDKDGNERIHRSVFIDSFLNSGFSTNQIEMESVADIFDENGDRFIDLNEYLNALQLNRDSVDQPLTESEMIQDEVQRQVNKCTCSVRYKVSQVGEGRYRFGNSERLRLVRILRSTVMVRVGGGWVSLDDFLIKNDPCRAKGRTNVELREKFVLADGVSQSLSPFKAKSPFQPDGTVSNTGPISKIREKTERSIPMSQSYRFGSSTNNENGSDLEDGMRSRSRTRMTPTGSRPGSRPSSRSGSHHSGSQPPSRAASDMSTSSVERYHSRIPKLSSSRNSGLNQPQNGTTGFARASSFTKTSSPIGPRWR